MGLRRPAGRVRDPRRAVARIITDGRLDEYPAEAARRLATAVEQALYAPRPGPVTGLSADIHHVRDGLHHSADRVTRLRASLLPRSAARLGWSLSLRWTATTAAWGRRCGGREPRCGGARPGRARRPVDR